MDYSKAPTLPATFINFTKWVTRGALTGCFVQQGDTNVPVIESNAMDMMRNQLEEKESKAMMMIYLTSNNIIQVTVW